MRFTFLIRCLREFDGFERRHYVATCVSVDLPDFGLMLEKPTSVFSVSVDLGRFRLDLKGTLDLLIGVRIPASQFPLTKIREYVLAT